jgi:RNA polymerase sigma factor (sigma-70 family)
MRFGIPLSKPGNPFTASISPDRSDLGSFRSCGTSAATSSEAASHEVRDEQIQVRASGSATDPARLHERSEASLIFWAALDTLADDHREILVLKDLQGFLYSEIAETLEIPEGTVASCLYHAREALCERNEEYP